jgi:hypothetical protein
MKYISNIIFLALIVCMGCESFKADQYVYLDGIKIQLLKPSNSAPASIKNTVISGSITSSDQKRICCLVGRIPDISHEIEEIHVTSSNNITSAIIWVHRYKIDAEKSVSGRWSITHLGRFIE